MKAESVLVDREGTAAILEQWREELQEFEDDHVPCLPRVDAIVHCSGTLGVPEDGMFGIDGFMSLLVHEFVLKMARLRTPEPQDIEGEAQLGFALPFSYIDAEGEPRLGKARMAITEDGAANLIVATEVHAVPPSKSELFPILVAAMNGELLRAAYDATGGNPLQD